MQQSNRRESKNRLKARDMKTTIITDRILFKKGRRIVCYIDIMPERIKVRTGKPSDSCCISWEYKPNELEKAKATATEFFDNVTRIWTTEQNTERGRKEQHFAPFLFAHTSEREKETTTPTKGKPRTSHKERQGKERGQAKDNKGKAPEDMRRRWKKEKIGANTPQAI